jgi:DNA topoisomerase-1
VTAHAPAPTGLATSGGEALVHVSGGELGLRRERRGDRFVVVDAGGEPVRDAQTLDRVASLRIPPAWTDVWIAARPNAHLQATGLDAKGRRQYLYHPAWRARRDEEKFSDMRMFADRLPAVRAHVRGLLDTPWARRDHALALAVRLLDVGLFRVGWDRHSRDTGHVGLVTLRRDQVSLLDTGVRFDYVAKSGKRRRMTVVDPQALQAIVPLKRRRSGPQELLAFRDRSRDWRRLHAPDVNNALRCWAQGPFSAKEFRTWAATVLAAVALAREAAEGHHGARAVNRAVRQVSTALGNTPAVARKSYIDPRVIELYDQGTVVQLPEGLSPAAVPMHIDLADDGIVIELPTAVDGDAVRVEVERRVLELLATG